MLCYFLTVYKFKKPFDITPYIPVFTFVRHRHIFIYAISYTMPDGHPRRFKVAAIPPVSTYKLRTCLPRYTQTVHVVRKTVSHVPGDVYSIAVVLFSFTFFGIFSRPVAECNSTWSYLDTFCPCGQTQLSRKRHILNIVYSLAP